MSKEALKKAVDLAGGQVHLAAGIRARIAGSKIAQPHISGWLNSVKMEVPPAEVVIPICETCEWQITPHELRPDVYPNASDGLPVSGNVAPIDRRTNPEPTHVMRERRTAGGVDHKEAA